jgi:hypothetical protein
MKTIITTATAALFAAAEIYDVLGKGNPDLSLPTHEHSAYRKWAVKPRISIAGHHGNRR